MVMDSRRFKELLAKPELLKGADISQIKSILEAYPFFQPARALYLKGLRNQDSFRYNHELKQTAAYTIDRRVLFDFITSEGFLKKDDIHEMIHQKIDERNEKSNLEEKTLSKPSSKQISKELEIGKPLEFTKDETHSFNQWLQLSVKKPIERKKIEKNPKKEKLQIIDAFLKNNPKITPVEKKHTPEVELPKLKTDKSLMTQTLAKVYLEQKKYAKAIKAYEILSLKYPEKSGFFADQIKKIEILQKNKS